jgi:hypothetical protein
MISFLWYSNSAWWWLFILELKHFTLNVYNITYNLSCHQGTVSLYSVYVHNGISLLKITSYMTEDKQYWQPGSNTKRKPDNAYYHAISCEGPSSNRRSNQFTQVYYKNSVYTKWQNAQLAQKYYKVRDISHKKGGGSQVFGKIFSAVLLSKESSTKILQLCRE